jgi:hypothetical protein
VPSDAEDPEAQLAPFADRSVAERISDMINSQLANDVAAVLRGSGRPTRHQACAYLQPTIVHCPKPEHPLANREVPFPFASVVAVNENEIPNSLGPSLVLTAIRQNQTLIDRLLASPFVGRLNLGAIPTKHIQFDQPHEGNLFDHLYARRPFQRAMAS